MIKLLLSLTTSAHAVGEQHSAQATQQNTRRRRSDYERLLSAVADADR